MSWNHLDRIPEFDILFPLNRLNDNHELQGFINSYISINRLPWWLSGKESTCMRETWVWSLVVKIPWWRKRQPFPAFLPGESHGQRGLCQRYHHEQQVLCRMELFAESIIMISLLYFLPLFIYFYLLNTGQMSIQKQIQVWSLSRVYNVQMKILNCILTCDNFVQLLFSNMRIQSFPKLFPNPQLRWWYSGKMCHFNPIACIKLHIRVSDKQLKMLARFSGNFISSKFLLLCQWWRWCVRSCLVLRWDDSVSRCHELRRLWPGACLLPPFLTWWWQRWLTVRH